METLDSVIHKLTKSEPRLVVQMPENTENADAWSNINLIDVQ
jgi:hypothetical protein